MLLADGGATVEMRCDQLKALFFVKTWEGDAQREKRRRFAAAPPEAAHGRKIAVRFKDGELLCGYSLANTPDREGFFIFPADADSNKMRVYVVTSSTAEVKVGPAAETLALRMLGSDPRPRKKHLE